MSLGQKVLTSSTLLIGIKFFQRLIGLVSILFLARLLTPEDFAIVALVSITVHFFDILSNAGSEQYIIQKDCVNAEDLNTAWTIDLSMKSMLWLTLISFSPWIAEFFDQPVLQTALYASSLILIINAAKNPGLFLKKQNFDYKQIFWLSVIQRVATFIIVIAIAYIEHSFWALIIGDIISSIIFTTGSYFIDKHRPKLGVKNWKKQWNFSGWLLLKGIIGYTRSQIDTLIVSKFFPAAQLGQYYMARDIAMIPSHNIILPAVEPLLAAFKQSRNDLKALAFQLQFSLFIISCISIPISMFLWSFSELVILTLLGNQWTTAAPLLSVISLLLLYFSFVLVLEQSLLSLQKLRALFWYDLISLTVITTGLLMYIYISDSLYELALLRGILGIITMLGLLLFVRTQIKVNLFRVVLTILPVFTASYLASFLTAKLSLPSKIPAINLTHQLLIFCGIFILLLSPLIKTIKFEEYKKLKIIIGDIFNQYRAQE